MKKGEKRRRSKIYYDMQVDMNKRIDVMLSALPVEKLEETLAAYGDIMTTESPEEGKIELPAEVVKSMALLSSAALSGVLQRRYRGREK